MSDLGAMFRESPANCRELKKSAWTKEEPHKNTESDDLLIAPFREDGITYGTLTWIWSVVVDETLYVRAYNGPKSRWYQAAVRRKAGKITIAGLTKEVNVEQVKWTDQRWHR